MRVPRSGDCPTFSALGRQGAVIEAGLAVHAFPIIPEKVPAQNIAPAVRMREAVVRRRALGVVRHLVREVGRADPLQALNCRGHGPDAAAQLRGDLPVAPALATEALYLGVPSCLALAPDLKSHMGVLPVNF